MLTRAGHAPPRPGLWCVARSDADAPTTAGLEWFRAPQANWKAATTFCKAKGMRLPVRKDLCPKYPGGAPVGGTKPGDQWVAFRDDPGGELNAWMQVGGGRPQLICQTHHGGVDGHNSPPEWGKGQRPELYTAWAACVPAAAAAATPVPTTTKPPSPYKFEFDGQCRGTGGQQGKDLGKMGRTACEARCSADKDCDAMEVNGCRRSAACVGECWTFKIGGTLSNGGNRDGDTKCFTPPKVAAVCTAGCSNEFIKCSKHWADRGKARAQAYDMCRNDLDKQINLISVSTAGCKGQAMCKDTAAMANLHAATPPPTPPPAMTTASNAGMRGAAAYLFLPFSSLLLSFICTNRVPGWRPCALAGFA